MPWLHAKLSSSSTPETCSDEKIYRSKWLSATRESLSPFQLAVAGGLIADRIEWIFIAGYQAAIRAQFPLTDFDFHRASHWLSVAVSEYKADKNIAGVSVTTSNTGTRLDGTKSWIASSDHVDALIVKVGRGEESCCFYVPANNDGVTIATQLNPRVMPALSQGEARFAAVNVGQDTAIDRMLLKTFSAQEALFIFVAATASLRANAENADAVFRQDAEGLLENIEKQLAALGAGTTLDASEIKPLSKNFMELYERYLKIPAIARLNGPAEKKLFSIYEGV